MLASNKVSLAIILLFYWGISSVGRALALHARGQEFESPILQLSFRCEALQAFSSCTKTRACFYQVDEVGWIGQGSKVRSMVADFGSLYDLGVGD